MDRLEFCRNLARDAGRFAHTAFGHVATSLKSRHAVVTVMDHDVERFIRSAIAARYPDDVTVGEEGAAHARGSERVWLIDAIDGRANYARGIPHYGVSIGYLERGVPTVGAVHDPSHDWLYSAARGDGAWRDDERLAVSRCADLATATIECGWSPQRGTADYLALVARLMVAGGAVRRVGSAALGLADVAAGRSEGYCELHLDALDCAAGILLVREAGGHTNDFFAGDGLVAGNPLIATNDALSAELAEVVGVKLGPDPG